MLPICRQFHNVPEAGPNWTRHGLWAIPGPSFVSQPKPHGQAWPKISIIKVVYVFENRTGLASLSGLRAGPEPNISPSS